MSVDSDILRNLLVVCVGGAILFWSHSPGDTEALEMELPSAPSTMSVAVTGIGPVPAKSLMPPEALEAIADEARQQRWRVPNNDSWPLKDETPVVETRQLDELTHTVRPGQSLSRIRRMYRAKGWQLHKWNPSTNLANLEAGDEIVVWKRKEDHHSVSYGPADAGRLYRGEPMPSGENYVILYEHRAFGTYYTVSEMRRVLNDFYEHYPDTPKLMIGDLSMRNGGDLSPHKSHTSGRDVDLSYPRKEPPPNYRWFHYVNSDELDVEKTLYLLKSLIDGGHVQYIFMDYYLQGMVKREARRQGATEEWLDRVFEYPEWDGSTAIIRHSPSHRNHIHIRFECQPTDRRCR